MVKYGNGQERAVAYVKYDYVNYGLDKEWQLSLAMM